MAEHWPVTVDISDDRKRYWQLGDGEVVLRFTKTLGPCHSSSDIIHVNEDELRATRDKINEYLGET